MAKIHGLIVLACIAVLTIGCASTQGSQHLSATGRVALQEVTAIAVRRAVTESPRSAEKARNIREIAVMLQESTSFTTVAELRTAVDAEVAKLSLNPVDQADANSLLNIFEALLVERLGTNEIDSEALVRVNEFLGMIVSALPAV